MSHSGAWFTMAAARGAIEQLLVRGDSAFQVAACLGDTSQHPEAVENEKLLADCPESRYRGLRRRLGGIELAHRRQMPGGEEVVDGQSPPIVDRGHHAVRLGQDDRSRGEIAIAIV